jgi:hypothetical protein
MAIPLGTSATRQTSGRRSAATSRGFYCSAWGARRSLFNDGGRPRAGISHVFLPARILDKKMTKEKPFSAERTFWRNAYVSED